MVTLLRPIDQHEPLNLPQEIPDKNTTAHLCITAVVKELRQISIT